MLGGRVLSVEKARVRANSFLDIVAAVWLQYEVQYIHQSMVRIIHKVLIVNDKNPLRV